MKRVGVAANLAAEPQRVWDLYADVERSVEWVPFMEEVDYISGPPGLGQVYRERTRQGGTTGAKCRACASNRAGGGPLGWLHERIVAKVAARGTRQAVTAAKRRLEAE